MLRTMLRNTGIRQMLQVCPALIRARPKCTGGHTENLRVQERWQRLSTLGAIKERILGTSMVNNPSGKRRWAHSSTQGYKSLRINGVRLMEELHSTCKFGTGERWGNAPTETGMSRLSLSAADKDARDWFAAEAQSLGCNVTVDSIGNMFAIRPGRFDGPPTCAGSHLDTQPSGGRYDGILGVLSGLEMLRVLEENKVRTTYPVGVINWTNEEGARFPLSMMGSGVWANVVTVEHAYSLKDIGGSGGSPTVRAELEKIGYLGDVPASYQCNPIAAHFELHIEQGPILEAENKKLGIVQGAQAYKWFTVHVNGQDAHTGTTPFDNRADALLLASKLILHSHRLATHHEALASTGILRLAPGSTNTIPGSVQFSLDIRASQDDVVTALEADLKHDFARLASGDDVGGLHNGCTQSSRSCTVAWTTDSETPATHFHKDCIACVQDAARDVLEDTPWRNTHGSSGDLARIMISGAGHDSVYTSKRCPTSMIFVPCREGISHNPTEYATAEDCEMGAQVLLQSILRYDALRASLR